MTSFFIACIRYVQVQIYKRNAFILYWKRMDHTKQPQLISIQPCSSFFLSCTSIFRLHSIVSIKVGKVLRHHITVNKDPLPSPIIIPNALPFLYAYCVYHCECVSCVDACVPETLYQMFLNGGLLTHSTVSLNFHNTTPPL